MEAESDQGEVSSLTIVRQFLEKTCGSVLKAWLKHLDVDVDYRISKIEFMEGMRQLNYTPQQLPRLFAGIDQDGSGEITLDEIDEEEMALWNRFRSWAVQTFYSVEDFIVTLAADPSSLTSLSAEVFSHVTEEKFCARLPELGWKQAKAGEEKHLFSALDFDGDGLVKPHCLRWLGIELKRLHKKRAAKESANKKKATPSISHERLEQQFFEFKEDLRRRYGGGNLVRAWRAALSDTMILPKTRFLKACVQLGYAKKAKDLWKMLDRDGSGFASIDELDPRSAQALAYFKKTLDQNHFAGISAAFTALDVDGARKIRRAQFRASLRRLQFQCPELSNELFDSLDLNGNHVIEEDDLQFLEKWHPLPYLTVEPNKRARDEFKKMLLQKYSRPMKAWRHVLDREGSNRCNWHTFLYASKMIGFQGDAAGAWRALDDDLSGYITLKELDFDAHMTLVEFRTWASDEFGSCRGAFDIFDGDGSNSLTFQEFRAACKIYGFEGQTKQLFTAMDVSAEGTLSVKEVAFLDDWIDDPKEVAQARKSIAAYLFSTNGVNLRGDPSRRGALAVGFENVKEMQRKLLEIERAKELAKQWHAAVENPMKLVDLCRKQMTFEVSSLKLDSRRPIRTVAESYRRLEGPDHCLNFFLKQAEPKEVSIEVKKPSEVRSQKDAPEMLLPPLPLAAEKQEMDPQGGEGREWPKVVQRRRPMVLKPSLDELLR
ncbi:unnamed protein product [Effrenium voratum]|uniref:EF-hand domain-containing protein n=1 Tax=Effrenium voratum TaxID=2562239 RepID=A0AA36J0T6_9DINO|nr:unnamed protein product [Effrenium voratum]